MTALSPLAFNNLMSPFSPFEDPPRIAIATSGGPDSMALALLADQWAKSHGGKAIALTIDHHLRQESTDEAQQVKIWLEARGIEHHILPWIHGQEAKKPQTGIQAAAREARYHLLGQWCKEHDVKHLLTAHHAQDQLETFMIRLAKGSGLKGLTGMQGEVATDYGRILRPLLGVDSQTLKETLLRFKQHSIEDPSNENEDFTRIRWRKLLPSLHAEGLTSATFQETIDRLNHAQRLIDQHISTLIDRHLEIIPQGYARLKKEVLQESTEAFEEILKRVIALIGTRQYPVRRQALHRAMNVLKSDDSITLGGCQIINKAKEWWIVREPAAMGSDILVNAPGAFLWDNRFKVVVKKGYPCRVGALGEAGIQSLTDESKAHFTGIPHVVLQTLPGLWQGEELIDPHPQYTFAYLKVA